MELPAAIPPPLLSPDVPPVMVMLFMLTVALSTSKTLDESFPSTVIPVEMLLASIDTSVSLFITNEPLTKVIVGVCSRLLLNVMESLLPKVPELTHSVVPTLPPLIEKIASRKVQSVPSSRLEVTSIVAAFTAPCARPKPSTLSRIALTNGERAGVVFFEFVACDSVDTTDE